MPFMSFATWATGAAVSARSSRTRISCDCNRPYNIRLGRPWGWRHAVCCMRRENLPIDDHQYASSISPLTTATTVTAAATATAVGIVNAGLRP